MSTARGITRKVRSWLAALAAGIAVLAPASEAKADAVQDAVGFVMTVCKQAQGMCGPVDLIPGIAQACFASTDEVQCALAIMGQSGDASSTYALSAMDMVLSCIVDGVVPSDCYGKVKSLGMSKAQEDEAMSMLMACYNISDVDGAIVCADKLMGSSFAAETGSGPPTYVDFLFDIYMDIKEGDYVGLVYHVGATIACTVATAFTGGVDVCGFIETLAGFANAAAEGIEAVGDFLNDLFGGGGPNCPQINGQCVDMGIEISKWLHKHVLNISIERRLAGGVVWEAHRPEAFLILLRDEPLYAAFKTTPAEAFGIKGLPDKKNMFGPEEEKGWLRYVSGVLYTLWDLKMTSIAMERSDKIKAWAKALKAEELEALYDKPPAEVKKMVVSYQQWCMSTVTTATRQIQEWMAEGRAGNFKSLTGSGPDMHCANAIAQRVLAASPLNPCTTLPQGDLVKAQCNTGKAVETCKATQAGLGKDFVQCEFGKGGESGTAQAALQQFAMALGKEGVKCVWGLAAKDLNAMHCQHPTQTAQCTKRMTQQYGNLGWPKPGVAECKTVATDKREKAVAAAGKIADALVPILHPGPMTAVQRQLFCTLDKDDKAVVVCQSEPNAGHLQQAKAKLGGIDVRFCSLTEASTSPNEPWLEEACVVRTKTATYNGPKDTTTTIPPPGGGTTLQPPKVIPMPGSGSASTGGSKAPAKAGTSPGPTDKKPGPPPAIPSSLSPSGK
jgi:hypothetical protein